MFWCFGDTVDLNTPKSRKKNDDRGYFDYVGIITTEYKWMAGHDPTKRKRL